MGSFTFDLTPMMTIASQLFTSLIPIVAVVGGLGLGAGLVSFVLHQVRHII